MFAISNIAFANSRSAKITSPLENEEVFGQAIFSAILTDDDKDDNVQWAVRKGTCAAGTNTVFGNVDGHNDAYVWDGVNFSATTDTTSWTVGQYCFIFNPTEGAGEDNIRLTREFMVNVDNTAPVVTIESPTEGNLVKGTISIYGSIIEAHELSHYNISIYPRDADFNDFSKRLEQKTEYLSSEFDNQLIYQWDTTIYNDGEYLIRLAARDKAGNRDLSGNPYIGGDDSQHVIKVMVDNTHPVITFVEPVDGSTYSGVINLKATCDETCNYINFWWRAEGETFSSASKRYHYVHEDGTVFEWDLDTLNAEKADGTFYTMTDGVYYLYAAGKDLAGNWARTPGEIKVIIDNVHTKAETLIGSGVPGKGLENAPGLQKPFNPKSQADKHAGKK